MSNRRDKNKPKNTINKQLEQSGAMTMEKDDNLIQLGKFFYSLAGMTYAGVVLAVLMDYREYKAVMLYLGTLAMIVLSVSAWTLIKIGNTKDNSLWNWYISS